MALGHDMRLSSPAMAPRRRGHHGRRRRRRRARAGRDGDALPRRHRARARRGICVTASHNPKEYTGMKIVRRGALPVGGDSGLAEIARPRRVRTSRNTQNAARSQSEDVWPSFVAKVLSLRRRGRDPSAPRRHRRGERNGRRHAPAGSREPAAARPRALLLRPGRELPEPRSPTRCCPRTASSSCAR